MGKGICGHNSTLSPSLQGDSRGMKFFWQSGMQQFLVWLIPKENNNFAVMTFLLCENFVC